jgi:Domain of unknown function (DUF3291)
LLNYVAEFNIARLRLPLDAPDNAEFVAVLEAVNKMAEASTGFVWRLTSDDHPSLNNLQLYDDPLIIVNFSVWTDLESLHHFVYRSGHGAYFRRRREWFEETTSKTVCWWVPEGSVPTVAQALIRLAHLERYGVTPQAFDLAASPPTGEP